MVGISVLLCVAVGVFLGIETSDEVEVLSNDVRTARQLRLLERAIDGYCEKRGKRPDSLRDLVTQGFVEPDLCKDGWGNSILYKKKGDKQIVLSSEGDPSVRRNLECTYVISRMFDVDYYDDSESTKPRYGYTNWCGRTRMDYPRRVRDWWMPANLSLPTNDLFPIVWSEHEGVSSDIHLSAPGHDTLFRIKTKVCTDAEAAHDAIMKEFSRMTIMARFLQITNDIGDVLFYRLYRRDGDYACFARNNVFVSISSDLSSYSATNIAKQIDTDILRASGLGPLTIWWRRLWQ